MSTLPAPSPRSLADMVPIVGVVFVPASRDASDDLDVWGAVTEHGPVRPRDLFVLVEGLTWARIVASLDRLIVEGDVVRPAPHLVDVVR